MLKRLEDRFARSSATLRVLSVNRISMTMGVLGLALNLAAAGFIAWKERATALREASEHARSRAFFLADHAARLFEVSDVALRATINSIGDFDWDGLSTSKAVVTEMRATQAALPYIDDLWLNDAAGRLRLTTFAFPAPSADISDRAIFGEVRRSVGDLVVGDPIVGRLTDRWTFMVARRLEWADGSFRGMISATTDVDYFRKYWSELDLPNEEHLALVRGVSGTVLFRFPDPFRSPAESGGADPALQAAVAEHPLSGSYDPAPGQLGFYHRVGAFPVYLTVVYAKAAVTQGWLAWLWRFLPFPLMALAALVGAMILSHWQSLGEARANREIERGRKQLSLANRRLEERVAERTAELRDSNDEIQRFAYIVSHDLRAPLINIMGFTAELARLRPDLFPQSADEAPASDAREFETAAAQRRLREDFDEAIGFITSSTEKMDRLIKAILLLSRQGRRTFEQERIDMNLLMQSVVDHFAHRLQTAGATIRIGPLPELVTDPSAVEQVFSNLIDNALKYLRPQVPGHIDIAAAVSASKAIFSVADNGRGIDPEDRGRIFDLFRRAGIQDQPGEGIGLAHVRALVRRLGGSIAVDSRLGQGAVFTVVLPLAAERGWP